MNSVLRVPAADTDSNPDYEAPAGQPAAPPADAFDPAAYEARTISRLTTLIETSEETYKKWRGEQDVMNLCYWRGKFWKHDGWQPQATDKLVNYASSQNEIFPILDSISSALALSLPQVELADHRVHVGAPPTRETDPAYFGQRVARALNVMAAEADFDETIREATLQAMVFAKGGIVKTMWPVERGMCDWTTKLPWEVFFDPGARRIRDCSWAFERFPLHYDDFLTRIQSGVYQRPTTGRKLTADAFPVSLVEDILLDDQEREDRRNSIREYILLHEFYDFRRGVFYHIHVPTMTVLLAAPIAFGNPYSVLQFNPAIGRMEGVPEVDYLAGTQTDINEIVSARLDYARTCVPKLVADNRMFKDAAAFEKFRKARANEITTVDKPSDMQSIEEGFALTPTPTTTPDLRQHLSEAVESIRYRAGVGSMDRGVPENIRTAAEADAIRARTDSRLRVKSGLVVKTVANCFKTGLRALQWATTNAKDLGWQPEALYSATVEGIPFEQWRSEVLSPAATHDFRILPFSPLMEDPITRRKYLMDLIDKIGGADIALNFDQRELAREIQEGFQLRRSLVRAEPPPPPGAPALPGGAPGSAPGGPAPAPMPAAPPSIEPLPPDIPPPGDNNMLAAPDAGGLAGTGGAPSPSQNALLAQLAQAARP